MCFRSRHVFTVIRANPVRNVCLVRWVYIHVVLSRSRHIKVFILGFSVHAKVELRVLAHLFRLKLILKVKFTCDIVLSRTRVSV
jgi:hypothetical protein